MMFRRHGKSPGEPIEIANRRELLALLADDLAPYSLRVADDKVAISPFGNEYIVTIDGYGVAGYLDGRVW